jgi:hypothetical protein
VRERAYMPKKIIIETGEKDDSMGHEFKDEFRKLHEHRPFGGDRVRKHDIRGRSEKEVKLFVNKSEMVSFVNGLQNIQNVEIFKIEDDLYKVLVTRHKKDEDIKSSKQSNEPQYTKEQRKEYMKILNRNKSNKE